ncbi:hypothetical protein METP3_02594 [Methanosarcinales archaeon]|nr:hypothetical protein METP3_02594 [Methanosarcinales archaeon]
MGVEISEHSIDRGVQKGESGMIKLPFNIQLKNNVRSEFLGDISKIKPEISCNSERILYLFPIMNTSFFPAVNINTHYTSICIDDHGIHYNFN